MHRNWRNEVYGNVLFACDLSFLITSKESPYIQTERSAEACGRKQLDIRVTLFGQEEITGPQRHRMIINDSQSGRDKTTTEVTN